VDEKENDAFARESTRAVDRAARCERDRRTIAATVEERTGVERASASGRAERGWARAMYSSSSSPVIPRVRALSESESEDLEFDVVERDARAWSAYDATGAATLDGEAAQRAVVRLELEEARESRPRRRAVIKAAAVRVAEARKATTVKAKASKGDKESEEPTKATTEEEDEDDGPDLTQSSMRISAPAQVRSTFVCDASPRASEGTFKRVAESKLTTKVAAKKQVSAVKSSKVDSTLANEASCGDESVRVLFSTGYSEREQKLMTRKVEKLGGSVVRSLKDFTVFVTEAPLKRTKNVMAAALRHRPIVKSAWIDKSYKDGKWLPPKRFLVRDKAFESEHAFDPTRVDGNPFQGKFWFLDDSSFAREGSPRTPPGVVDVVSQLLDIGGARRVARESDANLIVHLHAPPESGSTISKSSLDRMTPSDVLAACLRGSRDA